jgi:hypothetical protein
MVAYNEVKLRLWSSEFNTQRFMRSTFFRIIMLGLGICLRFANSAEAIDSSFGKSEAGNGQPNSAEALAFFESSIRPLLVEHCYECHSHRSAKLMGGLFLDSRQGLIRGGESGSAIDEKSWADSLILSAVRYDSMEMPPEGKLPDEAIKKIEKWLSLGAPWPNEPEPSSSKPTSEFDLTKRKQEHWVWRPIERPQVPTVQAADWPANDVDRFILAKLEDAKLKPAMPVDRRSLMRRLYFDLIGLPPTIEQQQRFLKDESPAALPMLVDELLNSPHFGERWGRHWLDLVRYAESRGHEFDYDVPNAFQYRDYVIRAFNEDLPYDQFVLEHIAGDLVPKPRLHSEAGWNESILGTGFWFFGEWVHSPVDTLKDESDRFDNMIDVMSKTFLGQTVACARCHDHKFDPISTKDYYALAGFLQSSDYRQVRFETVEEERRTASQLHDLDQRYAEQIRGWLQENLNEIVKSGDHPGSNANGDSELSSASTSGSNLVKASQSNDEESVASTEESEPAISFDAGGEAAIEFEKCPAEGEGTRSLVDYRNLSPDEYRQNGFSFGQSPSTIGDIRLIENARGVTLEIVPFSAARNDPFWFGLRNRSAPSVQGGGLDWNLRSGRTLRSPTFELEEGQVLIQLCGEGEIFACVDSHRQLGGPLHKETRVNLPERRTNKPGGRVVRWVAMDLTRYAGHRIHLEFTPAIDRSLEIVQVVEWLKSRSSETKAAELSQKIEREKFLAEWQAGKLIDEPSTSQMIAVMNQLLQRHLAQKGKREAWLATLQKQVYGWAEQRQRLQALAPKESRLAPAMSDGSGEDSPVYIRGNSSNPGGIVTRRFLEAVDGDGPLPHLSNSGRLELAQRINAADNPLSHRVIVNRIWHHLLGRGIVPTTDDFGVLGQRPTHPELLDYLACDFRENGQSIKKSIRQIVLSRAYQMSSQPDPHAASTDPKNLLWHHVPPKRLPGEAIRDALLTISDQMDGRMFGFSIPVHCTEFMDGRGRPKVNGPLDGDNRRSIYLEVRRNFLSPWMLAFDTPSPFSTMGTRNVSNVPAQALLLMNDPLVWKQAEAIVSRLDKLDLQDSGERIQWLYQAMFARLPSEKEVNVARSYFDQRPASESSKSVEGSPWSDLVHSMINSKEFIFVR